MSCFAAVSGLTQFGAALAAKSFIWLLSFSLRLLLGVSGSVTLYMAVPLLWSCAERVHLACLAMSSRQCLDPALKSCHQLTQGYSLWT